MEKVYHRSPNYPSMSIEDAIAKARVIWDHAKRQTVAAEKVAGYWNYGIKSSGWRLSLGALRQYGLIEKVGGKKSEHKLTELAIGIILDVRESSPDRVAAIKRAALEPPIYKELWNHWNGKLPNDDVVKTYLTLNKGFNEGAVSGFIADFKKTIAFAKLGADDRIDPADETEESSLTRTLRQIQEKEKQKNSQPPAQLRKPIMTAGTKEATLPLDTGMLYLAWPEDISQDEIEDVANWMEMMIRKMKRSATQSIKDQATEHREDDE